MSSLFLFSKIKPDSNCALVTTCGNMQTLMPCNYRALKEVLKRIGISENDLGIWRVKRVKGFAPNLKPVTQ